MNILMVRVFVRVREPAASHQDLAARLDYAEDIQAQQTSVIRAVVEEIELLKVTPAIPPKRRIGFSGP